MLAAAAIAFAASSASQAATVTFINSNGNWDVASNWSSGAVPTASDDAQIGFLSGSTITTCVVNNTNNLFANSVTLGDGNNLQRGQIFFDGGTLTVGGGSGVIQSGNGTADGWAIFQNIYTNATDSYHAVVINAATVNVDSAYIGQGGTGGQYTIPVGQSWSGGGELVLGNANGNANPGQGILTINGSASFNTVIVSNGATTYSSILTLANGGSLNTGTLELGTNGTGQVIWNDGTLGNLGSANMTVSGLNLQLAATGSHVFSVSTGNTATVGSTAALVDQTSGGTLDKAGGGTLVLNSANTYTGATSVSGGVLTVNGSLANSNITISSGATVNGSGTLTYNLSNDTGNLITDGGTLDISALNLALNITGTQTQSKYVIADYTGGALLGSAFASVTGLQNGWSINYGALQPNEIVLVNNAAVPEPASLGQLVAGILGLCLLGRRRKVSA